MNYMGQVSQLGNDASSTEQFEKPGTVGRWFKPILILDENKKEVKDGCIGELYASTPIIFHIIGKIK